MIAVEAQAPKLARQAVLDVRSFAGLDASQLRPIIDGIVRDPYIAGRVRYDHREPGFIHHPDVTYYGTYVDDELVGVYCVIASGFIEVDVHAFLSRKALLHSVALGHLMAARIFADQEINRITAQIIEGLESVCNHCKRFGFVYEGFRRGAILKGGHPVGMHVLGLTRADWEASK